MSVTVAGVLQRASAIDTTEANSVGKVKAIDDGALPPLSGLQCPLAVGTPRPSVDHADQIAPRSLFLPAYCDVATLGSLKPHKGVGFQPSEALTYRGSRHTTQTPNRTGILATLLLSMCHSSLTRLFQGDRSGLPDQIGAVTFRARYSAARSTALEHQMHAGLLP